MPTFPIEVNGQIVPVEAPDLESAMTALADMGVVKAPVTAGGLATQGAASLGRGTALAAGLPGTLRDMMQGGLSGGIRKIYKGVTGDEPNPEAGMGNGFGLTSGYWSPSAMLERFSAGPTEKVQKALGIDRNGVRVGGGVGSGPELAGVLGELTGGFTERQPQNVPEEYLRTLGEFVPTAAMLGGFNPTAIVAGGVTPAVGSETAGQLARNFAPENRPQWMPEWVPDAETSARIVGAVMTPSLLSKTQSLITPHKAPAGKTARLKAAKYFEKENIPYSAAQKTGSKDLAFRETETGGAAYADFVEQQQMAFTKAALKRIGVDAEEVTSANLIEANTRIGGMFDRLASRNSISPGNQLNSELRDTVRTYFDKVGKPNRAPIVENTIKEITNAIAKGRITGQQYQSMITRLREAGTGANADLAMATRSLRKNLDDAMERSIAQNNPSDLGAWRVARNNYRDLVAIEDATVTGAGGVEGIINPVKLHQVTTKQIGKRGSAQQKTDLNELATQGKILMRQIAPDSGTASRMRMRLGGSAAYGGTIGAGIGNLVVPGLGGLVGGGVGLLAGPALSALKSKVLMSPSMQKYLGNQVLKKPPPIMNPRGGNLPPRGPHPGSRATAPPPASTGGIMRMLEQAEAANSAGKPRYAGGHNVD